MHCGAAALAGSIVSGISFVLAGAFLFRRGAASIRWPARPRSAVTLVFATNPNVLYLQSTAMTEPLFMAALSGCLVFHGAVPRYAIVAGGLRRGMAALCGTLTRYDGWFLIPFVALVRAGGGEAAAHRRRRRCSPRSHAWDRSTGWGTTGGAARTRSISTTVLIPPRGFRDRPIIRACITG